MTSLAFHAGAASGTDTGQSSLAQLVTFNKGVVLASVAANLAGTNGTANLRAYVWRVSDQTLVAQGSLVAVSSTRQDWAFPITATLAANVQYAIGTELVSGSGFATRYPSATLTYPHTHSNGQVTATLGGAVFTTSLAGYPSSSFASEDVVQSLDVTLSNQAPNAPTLNSPPTNGLIDLASVNRFAWTFSDPNAGDSQSKFDLQYRLIGASTWTTVTGTTPNSYYDFAANTFAAGNYEWQVRTYDAQGLVGPWSSSSFFTAAVAPPSPTITAPVNGSTVSSSATVTWSAPNQTDYEVRRVADNAGSADTSTVYWDSGDVVDAATRTLPGGLTFATNNRWEHVQVRIKNAGLWSTWADARVQVSFTPPAIPTRVLAADSTTAAITVAIINPTPGAGQPAVAYNDVYVDDDDGLGLVRKATMLATNAAWIYRLPRSGVDYSTRIVVRAVATNGTTADSA